ncbi:MAG: tetratricopeptide repeat protein, partial [Treponema sp.]
MKLKFYSLFIILSFISCNINKNDKLIMLQGYISWQQKNWNMANSYFLHAKEIAELKNNTNTCNYALYALGSTYLMQNENEASMNSLIQLENVLEKELSSSIFYQLGIVAFKQQQYEKACMYFKKSL